MKKIVLFIIFIVSIAFGIFMYQKQDYVSSEAVFVATDSLTNLAFKIDGKIKIMTKKEADSVQKGELLASLQTKTLNTKLKQIIYQIKSLQNQKESLIIQKDKLQKELNLKQQISKKQLNDIENKIKSFEYQILANQAKLDKLCSDKKKYFALYKTNKISFDTYYEIKTNYEYLKNMILSQKQTLKSLKIQKQIANKNLDLIKNSYKEIDLLQEKIKSLNNTILSTLQEKQDILIKLQDSNLYAPFDGVIAKKFVNTDMVVDKGSFIYSLVNPKDIYIKVLLSEKKLSGIHKGCKAVVSLDALNNKITGEVETIMPVSASTFSLVPRDIASGEFTKLAQRFIVKIKIPYNPKLRIGMGGEVKIYKKD